MSKYEEDEDSWVWKGGVDKISFYFSVLGLGFGSSFIVSSVFSL